MGISVVGGSAGGTTNKAFKEQVFKSSGTWTYPTSSNFDGQVEVMLVGGGGASGGCASRFSVGGSYVYTGGGGGGQVILSKKLNVSGLGNQTIRVGNGGGYYYNQGGGLFGGSSRFGNNVIYNYYTNPSLSLGMLNHNAYAISTEPYPELYNNSDQSYATYGSVSTNWSARSITSAPPIGNTFFYANLSNSYGLYTLPFEVDPSINYTLSFYVARYGTTGTAMSIRVYWYDETGQTVSNNVYSSAWTTPTSYSWTQVSIPLTTAAPSTARYARIIFIPNGTAGFAMNGLCFSPTSLSVSTPIDGDTPGYTWGGSPGNSPTIIDDNSGYIAQGGGGGWGAGTRWSGGSSTFLYPGWSAYTSGGMPWYGSTPSTTDYISSGAGGGAGGDAKSMYSLTNYNVTANSATYFRMNYGSAKGGPKRVGVGGNPQSYTAGPYAGRSLVSGGVGGHSTFMYTGEGAEWESLYYGKAGDGIGGFGYGGIGRGKAGGVSDAQYAEDFESIRNMPYYDIQNIDSERMKRFYTVLPNTGNGAPGFLQSVSGFSSDYAGIPGSTGLVIVRWYE